MPDIPTLLHPGSCAGGAALTGRLAAAYGPAPRAVDLLDYPPERLASESLVMIMAAGLPNGEPDETLQPLWQWLETAGPGPALPRLRFTVLALGQRPYPRSFDAGRDLHHLLLSRGASPVGPVVAALPCCSCRLRLWTRQTFCLLLAPEIFPDLPPHSLAETSLIH